MNHITPFPHHKSSHFGNLQKTDRGLGTNVCGKGLIAAFLSKTDTSSALGTAVWQVHSPASTQRLVRTVQGQRKPSHQDCRRGHCSLAAKCLLRWLRAPTFAWCCEALTAKTSFVCIHFCCQLCRSIFRQLSSPSRAPQPGHHLLTARSPSLKHVARKKK